MVEEQMGQAGEVEPVQPVAPETLTDASELQKLLEAARAQSAEYLANWQRAAADFSNYKKRTERDNAELAKYASSALIARLLPVLDDLDRAFQTVPDNLRDLTWIDGIFLIARKLTAILEAEGLKPVEALHKPFDPNIHEAVIHEETDQHEDGTVIAELQRGYKLGERILRPTMVKVAKEKQKISS